MHPDEKEIAGRKANSKGVETMDAKQERAICEAAVALLRRQRHDYLNYLQVVQAYLQMGKPEKALAYLEKATEEMRAVDFYKLACSEETVWNACKCEKSDA